MNLLKEAMSRCVMLDKRTVSDGMGGFIHEWSEGAKFDSAITFNNSMESRTAQAQGVSSVYTVTTNKSVTLQYHDVFRRLKDGKVFRVTSDGDDQFTPDSASLNMRQVSAEEWELPT